MALNVPDGDVIAAFSHTLTGWSRPLVCTLGIGMDTEAEADVTFANSVFGVWAAALDTSVSPSLTFSSVTLYQKRPLGYVPVTSTSAGVVGTSSGTSVPPNVAVMVNKNTLRPGRAGRGRFFLPGFNESAVDPNGNITSAARTQLATDLAALRTNLLALGPLDDLLLYHDESDIDPSPTIIESFTADARVSSIAKRFRRSS